MQLALHPSAAAGLRPDSPWVARKNKILIGSVAALSAGVIAVGPAVQNGATLELHQVQQRAVQMVAEVTDSPLAVYGNLVNSTIYNLNGLISTYAKNPLPILSAIASNQAGYLKRILDFSAAQTAFQTWWTVGTRESAPGKDLVASVQSAIGSGNIGLAYENFNKLVLFGVQNTVLPWLNGWFFGTATNPSIFTQMAQNLTDATTAFFSTGTLVYGAFQAVYAPFSGAAFELSKALGTVGSSLGAGNVVAALTALVNTPGAVLNAFLNGFDYSDTQNPWAGLLSWRDPSCTGRCASGGPISEFFITIANKIATAIKNVAPAAAATATAAAATTATATTDATTADVASAAVVPASNTVTLTVADAADTDTAKVAEKASAATETTAAAEEATAPVTAETAPVAESTTTDTTPAESTPAESTKTDTTPSDTAKDDTTADSTKAESTKADSTKSGSKRGTKKSDTAKAETTKTDDTTKADSTKADTVKSGTHKRGTKHADASHSSEGGSSSSASSSGSSE